MKYWEIVADNLSKAGWSWGCVSAIDSQGRALWIADAQRRKALRYARAEEKLTAFLELESAIRPTSTELHFLTKPAPATQFVVIWIKTDPRRNAASIIS